jgi:cation diffusion facilitator CzcD-associated flavoprotein CzcO
VSVMSDFCPVAIIGAGPYGLSIAAHLHARGVEFRIFGRPMHSWQTQMPAGMFLKSHGFASNLFDPQRRYTLERFCGENALQYSDYGIPVSLETFIAYGLSFQKQFVPAVEDRAVVAVEQCPEGFLLRLDDGDTVAARRVIVAVGASYFPYVPESLSQLSPDFLSHSSDHHELNRFAGRDVSVLGAGASALDLVALLHAAGANVRLVARRSSLSWNTEYDTYRPLWRRWYPMCGLGGGDWRKRFYEHGPMLFRRLPAKYRMEIVSTTLGPAGGWPVRQCVEQMPLLLGHSLQKAESRNGQVHLRLVASDGTEREVWTDHVIAATGYRVDLRRLPFLSEPIRSRLRSTASAPTLSGNFESSIPSLYFVGLASANTFGPVMRFTLGARYTARRLGWHVATSTVRGTVTRTAKPMRVAAAG